MNRKEHESEEDRILRVAHNLYVKMQRSTKSVLECTQLQCKTTMQLSLSPNLSNASLRQELPGQGGRGRREDQDRCLGLGLQD